MIEQQIEKLKTLQESYDVLATSIEVQLPAIADKIDNIKLPEIDTTELAKEATLNEMSSKLDNINVEVDLSTVAKQGENKEATLTAIYKLLIGSNEPSPDIPEGVEERLALILEFFGIKPIESYEFMTAEEVCSELEEIMTSMDLELTQEKAKEITNNTLNKG